MKMALMQLGSIADRENTTQPVRNPDGRTPLPSSLTAPQNRQIISLSAFSRPSREERERVRNTSTITPSKNKIWKPPIRQLIYKGCLSASPGKLTRLCFDNAQQRGRTGGKPSHDFRDHRKLLEVAKHAAYLPPQKLYGSDAVLKSIHELNLRLRYIDEGIRIDNVEISKGTRELRRDPKFARSIPVPSGLRDCWTLFDEDEDATEDEVEDSTPDKI